MPVNQNALNNTLSATALTGTLQAGQFPALTGDVSTSAGSLTTAIANSAVTYAKVQNVSGVRLLGNPTGSASAPSEISLGSGLEFSGSTLVATGGVTINTFQVDQTPAGDTYGALSGTVNGSNTTFTVSNGSYVSGTLRVSLNGQEQTQGASADWVETTPASGTFDFAIAPPTGSIVQASYIRSANTTDTLITTESVNEVTDVMLRQSAGLSVMGRSANSTGDVADIVSANDYEVVRRLGSEVGFGRIDARSLSFIGCRAYRSSDQSITAGSWVSIAFTAELYDTSGIHDNSTNPSRFTIPTGMGGYWHFAVQGNFYDAAAPTVARFRLVKNGTTDLSYSHADYSAPTVWVPFQFTGEFSAGDYVELQVWPDLDGSVLGGAPYVWMEGQFQGV